MRTDSTGSIAVEQEINRLGLNYKKEIPLCSGIRGGLLRADFAIYGVAEFPYAVVEFDGPHHRINCVEVDTQAANDRLKDQYCAEHDIPIFRVNWKNPDWSGLTEFLEGVRDKHPSTVRGHAVDFSRTRTLNLRPVDIKDIKPHRYTLEEVGHLIDRKPNVIFNRYILELQALENWSGKSYLHRVDNSRVDPSDLIRFLVEQEALFSENVILGRNHPVVISHLGVPETFKTLVLIPEGSPASVLASVGGVGELEVREVPVDHYEGLIDWHREISGWKWAQVLVGDIGDAIVRELDLYCSSAQVRFGQLT